MYLLYTIDAHNPRLPNERVVHCVDTSLSDRFFVKNTTTGDRTVKRLIDDLDDFIGYQDKDLTKPLQIMGIDNDDLGERVIHALIDKQPLFIDVQWGTASRAFRSKKSGTR